MVRVARIQTTAGNDAAAAKNAAAAVATRIAGALKIVRRTKTVVVVRKTHSTRRTTPDAKKNPHDGRKQARVWIVTTARKGATGTADNGGGAGMITTMNMPNNEVNNEKWQALLEKPVCGVGLLHPHLKTMQKRLMRGEGRGGGG
jgi:hypothetical protein